jgi:hypothetical protein
VSGRRPQWSFRAVFLAVAIIGITLLVFVVPGFKQPSNRGGNSEALSDVKLYVLTTRWTAETKPDHQFSIDRATPRELGQLREVLSGPTGSLAALRRPPPPLTPMAGAS